MSIKENKIVKYVIDSKNELKKVAWPTRKETIKNTMLVIGISLATAVFLGAGRSKKGEKIEHSVGIVVHHKVGNWVESGDPLFTIHANRQSVLEEAKQKLLEAVSWSDEPVDPLPLFYGVVK